MRLNASLADSLIKLPHNFLAAGSDTLLLDSTVTLSRGADYSINYRHGMVKLDSTFLARWLHEGTARPHTVSLRYLYFPFRFQESYSRRTLVVLKDSTGAGSIRIARPGSGFSAEDIFGPNLQKSGSIVRGFSVGSNRDLSLNSGLRLQLSGRIASDIEIAASLTDENTPIQPEGTTQTLQEFDKVFVEIKSTNWAATLGDFNLDIGGSEFARLSRKLQGAKGTGTYNLGMANGSAMVSGAITRGKFNTLQFSGQDGVQGPYRLTGRYGEPEIIVIAGTERVYVNGELQVRGEPNDYTIDYSTGEVQFTTRRLITAASRITIDYEYTDRQFQRSLLATQVTSRLFDNRVGLAFTYLREADDPESPIDFTFADSTRAILQNAGRDRGKAVISGVTKVDSNGYYVRVDTLLGTGEARQFYRYAPGAPGANYEIAFSYVGGGQGEYVRKQIGVFIWQGAGGGDYMPVRFLPMPELHQVVDFALNTNPTNDLKISAEFGRSIFNANRFAPPADAEQAGNAFKATAAFSPRNIRVGGLSIGGFDLSLNERLVSSRFIPIDRTNDIEFTRKWGVDTLLNADEEIREGSLKYMPDSSVSFGAGYGHFARGSETVSDRNEGTLTVKGRGLPNASYLVENIRAREEADDNMSSWLRQRGSLDYTVWRATPFFSFEEEKRTISSLSTSLMKEGSFGFTDVGAGVALKDLGPVAISAAMGWRTDNGFNNGGVIRESKSFTQSYTGKLAEVSNVSSSLDLTFRKRLFSSEFKQRGNSDIQTILVRNQTRYTPFNRGVEADFYYETSTQRSSRLERVFVRVAPGTGNYKYLGDLNNNGLADADEFVQTRFDGDFIVMTVPTDQLYPVIDLKTSARLRLTPARFLSQPDRIWERVLSVVTTESYIRVEENSTEHDLKQIYLLHLSKFQQDSTTIAGSRFFSQDLNFFENKPEFSTRFRFTERRSMNSYAGGIERGYGRERSVRLRWQLVAEISNQIDYVNKIDRIGTAQITSRLHDVLSNDLAFDLSYRPEQNLQVGFRFDMTQSDDRYPTPEQKADLNTESLRWVYAFLGAGQVRAEFSREEVRFTGPAEVFSYELTGGRVPGKTWLWRAAFDYRVTQFIQATLSYDGRSEGGNAPVHNARAEVRAFF
jgi:hypothetical protein